MSTNNINEFRKEDYPDSPPWWDRALFNLNLLVDFILALNTSVRANTSAIAAMPTFQNEEWTATSSASSTTNPENNTHSFTSTLPAAPKQLLIHVTNSSNPLIRPTVSWHYVNGIVYITSIAGLANNTQYNFTVTIF